MAHGGYGKRRIAERKHTGRRSKDLSVEKKPKAVSLKNQIRSIERMLRKVTPLFFSSINFRFSSVSWVLLSSTSTNLLAILSS